ALRPPEPRDSVARDEDPGSESRLSGMEGFVPKDPLPGLPKLLASHATRIAQSPAYQAWQPTEQQKLDALGRGKVSLNEAMRRRPGPDSVPVPGEDLELAEAAAILADAIDQGTFTDRRLSH